VDEQGEDTLIGETSSSPGPPVDPPSHKPSTKVFGQSPVSSSESGFSDIPARRDTGKSAAADANFPSRSPPSPFRAVLPRGQVGTIRTIGDVLCYLEELVNSAPAQILIAVLEE
jgi:hypothetical protein